MTDRRSRRLAPGRGRRRRVGSERETCFRSIEGRFEPEDAKCGDRIHLHADARNIPDGSTASFIIYDYRSDCMVEDLNGRLRSSQVRDLTWDSQKEDNQWHTPHLYFIVESYGEVARSENMFSFHRYEDISPDDVVRSFGSVACTVHSEAAGAFEIAQRVKVELDDRVLIIHVPIKVRKRSAVRPTPIPGENYPTYYARCQAVPLASDPNLTAAEKTTLKNRIEPYFRHKKALHRRGCRRGNGCTDACARKCCKIEIKVLVHFYDESDSTSASVVEYWPGSGHSDAMNWFMNDTASTNAHEVAHLMGFYDEYPRGGIGPAPWQHPNTGTLMCDESPGLEDYYFDAYAAWLGDSDRTDEPWDVVDYS